VSRQESITERIRAALDPSYLDVVDESRLHGVPPGSASHFKVLVVSRSFEGMGPVDRHRRVNQALAAEFAGGLHALTLRTLTPGEWERESTPPASPLCRGGSKAG
jgi:BolA protein